VQIVLSALAFSVVPKMIANALSDASFDIVFSRSCVVLARP
jgi:hypothetical protein